MTKLALAASVWVDKLGDFALTVTGHKTLRRLSFELTFYTTSNLIGRPTLSPNLCVTFGMTLPESQRLSLSAWTPSLNQMASKFKMNIQGCCPEHRKAMWLITLQSLPLDPLSSAILDIKLDLARLVWLEDGSSRCCQLSKQYRPVNQLRWRSFVEVWTNLSLKVMDFGGWAGSRVHREPFERFEQ
jgi:hypothetical protein